MCSAAAEGIVQIALSTRPDCISIKLLDMLSDFEKQTGIDVAIEFGLQTVNYHTLKKSTVVILLLNLLMLC